MRNVVWTIATLLLFTACSEAEKGASPAESDRAEIYFRNIPPDSSGLAFSNILTHKDDLNIIEYLYYYNGGGVALGDINDDGLEDVFLTANQGPDRLFLNQGNLRFRDITAQAGIQIDSSWSTGVTMEDINNDGLLDIYISKVGNYKSLRSHNLLYINQGELRFEEQSSKYGLDFSGFSTQASFLDYDKDGDMDMYLMNHSVHTPRSYGNTSRREESDSLAGDRFFENKLDQGLEHFEDVTQEVGIYSSALGYGLALATADINGDGWTDIYVGNDFHENDYLYINQGGQSFREAGADYLNHTARFTMGVDIEDMNGDLLPDIFTLDMMPYEAPVFLKSGGEDSDKVTQIKKGFGYGDQYARNTMQMNEGGTAFADVALMTGTHATDWSWSPLIQDFDNDGLVDIYITNGIYKRPNDLDYVNYLSSVDFAKYDKTRQDEVEARLIENMPTLKIPNVVFRNKGDLEFERLTERAGLYPSYSNGAAYGDLDNDGDLDIVVNNIDETAFLLENRSQTRNFIAFSLKGNDTLGNVTGSRVFLYAQGMEAMAELTPVKGFQSSSTHRLHFGLNDRKQIDSIRIVWPDGSIQTETGLAVNQIHSLARKSGLPKMDYTTPKEPGRTKVFQFTHLENNFLDYEIEPLIPEKLSTEGPAVVHADLNGDGLKDLFIGGARYQAPSLFFADKSGGFLEDKGSALRRDAIYEDVDATALDIENDGDLDLYVMSGGNDKPEGDPQLEDRIYINDGSGHFERLKLPLIKANGGSVSSADFNKDGFDDLFIGNRSIPGGYGLFPRSYLLVNDGTGRFEVIQQERVGMVTDSEWVDIDGDTLLDLVIVGDWMPVTVLLNQGNSRFLDQTKQLGLDKTYGMWNTVSAADLDQNGSADLLVGNTGLNFKIRTSQDRPMTLYLDDFDGNGQPDPLIFYDFFGKAVPFASKDKLGAQLPQLKKKFLSYTDFSKIASIEDLTGKKESEIAEIRQVMELRSMAYLNVADDFKAIPLPKEAQMSSIEDIIVDDQGRILYVGNFLGFTSELGQSAANTGGMLTVGESSELVASGKLPLPSGLNARKIVDLGQNRFLVISNNDRAYLLER